ncbi:MFS transporter [Streptomyces goshikiensis]|uniref:MFS transporter n=1 Tax=Streptomyces goshikiensis TaxID=1942 RepID=UPI0036798CAF
MSRHGEETGLATRPTSGNLWKNRNFTTFWLGQSLSVLGGSISVLALPLLALEATGSIVQMGAVTAIAGVAGIATGTFAGYVVDRTDRRRTMIVCDVVRAFVLCSLPPLWALGHHAWLLYTLTAVVAALKTIFDVAYVAAVVNLVDTDQLTSANSRLQGTFAVGSILGPALAGFIAAGVGASWALAIDGATFAVSALSLLFVRLAAPKEPRETGADGSAGLLRKVFAVGLRFIWEHPALRSLTILLTLLTFLTLGATDLLIFRVQHDLGRDSTTLGYLVAISGLGSILAAVTAGTLRRVVGFGTCWLGSVLLIALSVSVICTSRSLIVIAAMASTFMFAITLAGVSSMTLRQQVTPDHLLGRVTSAFWTVHNASGPVGAAVITLAADRYGVPAIGLAGGAFCLLIFAIGIFTPLRTARPEELTGRAPHITGTPPEGPPASSPLEDSDK